MRHLTEACSSLSLSESFFTIINLNKLVLQAVMSLKKTVVEVNQRRDDQAQERWCRKRWKEEIGFQVKKIERHK